MCLAALQEKRMKALVDAAQAFAFRSAIVTAAPCCTRLFVLLLYVWQVITHDEEAAKRGQGPLLSAAHQDTAVLWQRVQNVAEVSAQQQQQQQQQSQSSSSSAAGRIVLTAQVVSRNKGGLSMLCMGLQAFLPKSLLPFKIRDLYQQQVGLAEGCGWP
jgi:hypothetical protein